jgi:uncharacterized protein (TIGR00297 family)
MFSATIFANPWLSAIALNSLLLILAFLLPKKLLTTAGYFHAWVLGVLVWATLGWHGYAIVLFYFLVGSAVTRLGIQQKEAEGIAEKRAGARGPENVWGSALTAAICAVTTLFVSSPWQELLTVGYVASLATKLADTTASEIGKAYGKRTFLITTFQPVARGTEGALSLEGTLAGIAGSIAIALFARVLDTIDSAGILSCLIAAFVATNIESLIGATLQTKFSWLTNEVVNGINTAIGASIAMLITYYSW